MRPSRILAIIDTTSSTRLSKNQSTFNNRGVESKTWDSVSQNERSIQTGNAKSLETLLKRVAWEGSIQGRSADLSSAIQSLRNGLES
jgi:hypothetical protein